MKKQYLVFTLLFAILIIFQSCNDPRASFISSTYDKKWAVQPDIQLVNRPTSIAFSEVFLNKPQQTIKGWGGCFNELGWDAIQQLKIRQKDTIFNALFESGKGLNFNICRMPIGANDYARNWYSLDEVSGDFELKKFSIERDKSGLIPYIRLAMKYRPDLKLWASPWSPPCWMKTNKHYANKPGDHNDLTWERAVKNADQLIQQPRYLQAYARYLVKFVKAYKAQGIDVYAIHFQNEPYTFNQWPNCSWLPSSMACFIANYLGPTFNRELQGTQLWLGTWNTDKMANFDTVLGTNKAKKYLKGVGLQWEGKNIIRALHQKYPDMELMQTESECGEGDFSWKDAEHTFDLIKIYLDGGVTSYTYWNMVLGGKGTSSCGWNQNALIRLDGPEKKIVFTPEFYAFKHVSHYVTPGSVKLECSGTNMLAFKQPNGHIVIVEANHSALAQPIQIKIGSLYLNTVVRPRSFNTFMLNI